MANAQRKESVVLMFPRQQSYSARQQADAKVLEGQRFEEKGDDKQARDCYKKALSYDARSTRALVNLASLELNRKKFKKAKELCERAVLEEPRFALAHYNLALAFEGLKLRSRALDQYLEVLRLSPLNSDAHYNLALLYDKQLRFDSAKRHYEFYLKYSLAPDDEFTEHARRRIDCIEKKLRRKVWGSKIQAISPSKRISLVTPKRLAIL